VRYAHFGEGGYAESERVIRELLEEAGRTVGAQHADGRGITPSAQVTTPETYLGSLRAERFVNGAILPGAQDFGTPATPPDDHLAYAGVWRIARESATAVEGAALELRFGAAHVYLVLSSPGQPRRMRVLLDGRPLPDRLAGADVHGGVVTISEQRLYDLVDLPRVEHRLLRLEPEPGVSGYAFTFG
jgi:hypothetical protein